MLDENHYRNICSRLKDKGHRQGFACLFYGAPGTGKTESVLQLARKTGRDIMQVNISQVKSMWVGESEKNIKAIFDRYRAVAKNSKRVPILLFNEADAVIGIRKENAERSVDKMENSIQNIILQEMESLDGIMVATTNLVQNLDDAFERRFLYKVKFDKPELTQRAKIWQSMMPDLSEKTAEHLAAAYDFSGGQIENITRKCDIESILYGNDYVTDEKIEQYCREEKIIKKGSTRIGFTL
jgi:SpoVK/Ycf46/Vps4 family AAA+-type ATPase